VARHKSDHQDEEVTPEEQAEARRVSELLDVINGAIRSDLNAAVWLLARRWPNRWGPSTEEEADEDEQRMAGDKPWQVTAQELARPWPRYWGRRLRGEGPDDPDSPDDLPTAI
jgi:hypothetical protein